MSTGPSWTIIGDGPWGRALARVLSRNAQQVLLLGVKTSRRKLPAGVTHTTDAERALGASERVVMALSMADTERALEGLAALFAGHHRIVTTARGLSPVSHLRASEAVYRLTCVRQVAALAGAADAEALKADKPGALVVGSPFVSWAREIQGAMVRPHLRVYTSDDLTGVELADVLAHIMVIPVSIARALGAGAATEATALTRALAESERLVKALGGHSGTAYGLAGLGVITTLIFEGAGEGWMMGQHLAKGDVEKAMAVDPELAHGARALAARAARQGVETPMLKAVAGLLGGQFTAQQALETLMRRAARSE
ncbi:MAG: hypothetical protein ACE366_28300 [Bradymonadia bacterium]